MAVFVVLLALQHSMVKADDLSRIDVAFFSINGWASVIYFLCTAADLEWA